MIDKKDERYDYIVYKLCSDECDDSYIGSTRNITQRKRNHKSGCNNPKDKHYNTKIYRTMREFGGWDEWRLCPLELMKNSTKFEAECQEEVVRMRLKAELNSRRASCHGLTRQQYYKLYYEENRETLLEHQKKYRDENGDRIRERGKKYRDKNKETIAAKAKEKYDCECGGRFIHAERKRHSRTKIHQKYLNNLENET